MKRLPHSVRLGLCFPVMFGAALAALITNYVILFHVSVYGGVSLDFLSDQFTWSLFFFHTGFCIVGIILTAGDALLTRPDFEVEERYEKN